MLDFSLNNEPLDPIEKGSLLIAEPFLEDDTFGRSVIMICEYQDEGAFGLVVNKKSEWGISDLLPDLEKELPVYIGGPVEQNTLHFIHSFAEVPDAIHLYDNLYWGGDFSYILKLAENNVLTDDNIRFFVGYSGWGEHQISKEIEEDVWILNSDKKANLLSMTPEGTWKQLLDEMGGKYKMFANYPTNPRLN